MNMPYSILLINRESESTRLNIRTKKERHSHCLIYFQDPQLFDPYPLDASPTWFVQPVADSRQDAPGSKPTSPQGCRSGHSLS